MILNVPPPLSFLEALLAQTQSMGHKSCDVRFAVIHSVLQGSQHSYRLIAFFGCLTKDEPLTPSISPLGSCKLKDNRSAKLFRASFSLSDLRTLAHSISTSTLQLPQAPAAHCLIEHNFDLKDIKPLSFIAADNRNSGRLTFLPYPGSSLHMFEIFDLNKEVLKGLDSDDLTRIDKLFRAHTDFSPLWNTSTIGNLLIVANLEPIKIEFTGDKNGEGIRIMLVPENPKYDPKDYVLTITSEASDEVNGSSVIFPIPHSIHLPNISKRATIDARLWQISTAKLVSRNHGAVFNNVSISISTFEKLRTGYIRDKHGKVLRDGPVRSPVPLHHSGINKISWSEHIQRELLDAQKRNLIATKKLIPYREGMHLKALNDVVDLINSAPSIGPVKIWDPYLDDYYLDFLTFMTSTREVRILSALRSPSKDDRQKLKRFSKAFESCLNDYSKRLPKPLRVRWEEYQKRKSDERFQNKQKRWTQYLNELRANKLNIFFRYNARGKGFKFHDRFLIAGGRCWSLGTSLNHIGNSHSLIIELQYPELVENEFDALWKEVEGNDL